MTGAIRNSFKELDSEAGGNEAERFRSLALRYQEIGSLEGIKVTPFISSEMPLFQKATGEERKTATDFLQTIVDIHEETLAAGDKAVNTRQLIWRALRKFSLTPGPDVFENFTDEDVVIIYSENHSALFWNLQFFRFTSLTIEHLFFGRWYEFTKRDSQIQQTLYELLLDIISGKISGSFSPNVPGHVVEEIDTSECVRTWMELPYGTTLSRNGALGGILVVQKMRILE